MAESSRMAEDDGNSAEVRVGDESVKIVKEIPLVTLGDQSI